MLGSKREFAGALVCVSECVFVRVSVYVSCVAGAAAHAPGRTATAPLKAAAAAPCSAARTRWGGTSAQRSGRASCQSGRRGRGARWTPRSRPAGAGVTCGARALQALCGCYCCVPPAGAACGARALQARCGCYCCVPPAGAVCGARALQARCGCYCCTRPAGVACTVQARETHPAFAAPCGGRRVCVWAHLLDDAPCNAPDLPRTVHVLGMLKGLPGDGRHLNLSPPSGYLFAYRHQGCPLKMHTPFSMPVHQQAPLYSWYTLQHAHLCT